MHENITRSWVHDVSKTGSEQLKNTVETISQTQHNFVQSKMILILAI